MITAKLWKYISGVSKVVDEEENEKTLKAARDTREYEKTNKLWASEKWSVLSKLSVQPCLITTKSPLTCIILCNSVQ